MPDSHPDTETGQWLTYRQIADLRRISKASAERLVRRHRWRRQEDNQGVTRALVPPEWADPAPGRATDSPPDIRDDGSPDITRATAAFEAALVAVREARDAEIATLRVANATLREQLAQSVTLIDGVREERDRADASLSAERARADALHGRIEALQEQLASRPEGVDVTEAIRQAEAMVHSFREAQAGEVNALKAERHRLATQIDGFATRADQAEARTDSLRARVDVLQRERDTARAEATQAAEGLRQAEAARKGRGRLARLRAAWRGE